MVPGLCLSRAAPLCGPLTPEEQTLEGSILSSDIDLTRIKYPLIRTQSYFQWAPLWQLTNKNGTLS